MARQSFSRLITGRALLEPGAVVVVEDDTELTAADLDRRSNRLARELLALGVGRDDPVVVSLPTSIEFVVACVAVWKVGATPQPVAPSLADDERADLERLARPALVIGTPPRDASIPFLPQGFTPDPRLPDSVLRDAFASSWKAPISSGSTGRPKVVMANAPALLDADRPIAAFLPRRAVQLVLSPLWHSASFTYAFRGLLTGHRLVLTDGFDELRFVELVRRHGVTWTLLSPSMIHALIRAPRREGVGSLESVLHMGGPCAESDKRALIDWLGPERVVEVYAGSESNGLTMITGTDWLIRPGSVGKPIGGTEIRIQRDDGAIASAGEVGTIWMRRGERPAYRYLGAASRRTTDGWDTLGDLGMLDADGYLTVVERVADVIGAGAQRVFPSRVEHVLEAHPDVRGAVVFGVADRVAAVVDVGEAELDADDLRAFAGARLAPHEMPCHIDVTRRSLRNAAGKVRRSTYASLHRNPAPH